MCTYNIYTFVRWPWTLVDASVFQRLVWIKFALVWVLLFKVYVRILKCEAAE